MICNVRQLGSRYATVRAMLAVPAVAESLTAWIVASARRDGLCDSDADDAGQRFFLLLLKTPEDIDPVRAVFGCRKYLRRSGWMDRTGARRAKSRKLPRPVDDINRTMRGSSVDNPALLAMAVESATRLTSLACGRNARWLRSLSADDVRAMLCPSVQDGTPVVVADPVPVDMTPRPATPDDGTGHRPMSEFWTKKIFPGIPYHTAD